MAKQDIKAGSAYVELLLKDNRFVSGLAAAKNKLKSFAKAAAVGMVALGAAAVAGATAAVASLMKLGDQFDKMSQRTGISVEALSELKHAAEQSGTSIEDVEKGVRKMQRTVVDAAMGSKMAAESFGALGLSVDDLSKMSPEEQFNAVTKSLEAIQDPTIRAGLAMQIFGRSGTAMIPMLGSMEALRQEARDLGIVMSNDTAKAGARLTDMWANLKKSMTQIFVTIGSVLAPALEYGMAVVQHFVTNTVQWFRSNEETVRSTLNNVGSIFQNVWGFAQSIVNGAVKVIVFAITDWQRIVNLAMVGAGLGVVRFANQTIYFFSEVIPAYLIWFYNNWRDIFTDVVNVTATIAKNIWANLVALWDAIEGLFSGEGFNFEWTPLTDGFESAIKELPKIAEREMGPLEKDLQSQFDKLSGDVAESWQNFSKTFDEEFKKNSPALAAALPGGAGGPAKPELPNLDDFNMNAAKKNITAVFASSAAAASGGGGVANKQLNALESIARTNKQLVDQGKGDKLT